MPPIIKKQIKKAQKIDSFVGYIKLVPLLVFIGFLIFGWLISLSALKVFKIKQQFCDLNISPISIIYAGEGGGEGCGCDCETCSESAGGSCASCGDCTEGCADGGCDSCGCGGGGCAGEGGGESCGEGCASCSSCSSCSCITCWR